MSIRRGFLFALTLVSAICAGCAEEAGNSPGSTSGGSVARVAARDGAAICVFVGGDKEFKIGKVEGDQVALFATYGGGVVLWDQVDQAVAALAPGDVAANQGGQGQAEQRALANRLFELQLPGIWQADFVVVNGRYEPVDLEAPIYLILRDNWTFRIVKKGRKPRGSWQLDDSGKLLMDVEGDASKVVTFTFQPSDKLELQFEEDGNPLKMEFIRSDLKEEPKGISEA